MTSVIGDSRWPKYHPNTTQISLGHTYPPKILCAAFQMQYHKPSEPQRNETTQDKLILDDELHDNTFHCSKQCHNWMCTTYSTVKMWIMIIMIKIMIIMKIMDYTEK